ncbi:MAG: helix-turn-helix transcriptional regulator [Steroidobacteraceae bacterium]
MNRPSPALPETLREARKARRMSQLELSMRVGVSQRHMSFVESGRSNPSRGPAARSARHGTERLHAGWSPPTMPRVR